MLHLDTGWCLQVQQAMWEVSRFEPVEKGRIDDSPLYEQYCMTMAQLMDETVRPQEKERKLFDLAGAVFAVACRPQAIRREHGVKIEKLKKMLSADLQKDLTIRSLAREIDLNPFTLIRSFKAAAGITPHAYRMNCRIAQARALLRQGRDIADTALACGFYDQSHFHRHFKAMTTVTPQQYRVNFVQ